MTRVNLVPPEELTDQHLFSEFRELKMIPKSLRRSIAARGIDGIPLMVPKSFTLNAGHVSFFYNKGLYLRKRYELLKAELLHRGFDINVESPLDPDAMYAAYPHLDNDYTPTAEALVIIRERIAERIATRPHWYRKNGNPII